MSKTSQSLTAIPLGGLGEFGMNMMALRLGDEIIVIDAGMMFPESELLGVDLVIPDITYLKQNRAHVRAIVLTHGHEDHIGALPYILRELNVPVYGTRFTLALVKKRLDEAGLLDSTTLREVIPGRLVEIGPYEIEFISVTQPKPRPRAIFPASHPAISPRRSHETILCDSNQTLTVFCVTTCSASIRPPSRTRIVYEFAVQASKRMLERNPVL